MMKLPLGIIIALFGLLPVWFLFMQAVSGLDSIVPIVIFIAGCIGIAFLAAYFDGHLTT